MDDITKLSYRFVTVRGNYEVYSLLVSGNAEETYKAAFLDICKEIEKGEFPPIKGQVNLHDEKDLKVDCRYCGYKNMCKFVNADEE